MWKGIVGRSFDPMGFDTYVKGLKFGLWRPQFVVLHNTSVPSLAQRPDGFTKQHIKNLEGYYRDEMKWSSGPNLFVDDHQIWVLSPLTAPGTHSPSWNAVSWGVEMLGEYESEPFNSGRGLHVQYYTVAALATLHAAAGLDSHSLRFHKEDPKTTHKECPGRNVYKPDLIGKVHSMIVSRHEGEHKPGGAL
jgi:hypothetical protein